MKKRIKAKFKEEGHDRTSLFLIIIILAGAFLGTLGWLRIFKVRILYNLDSNYPRSSHAAAVIDGETIVLGDGNQVKLIGTNAPTLGERGYTEAKNLLNILTESGGIELKYDPQLPKQEVLRAYVFIKCREQLSDFCRSGKILVNEVLIKEGLVEYTKSDRPLVYEEFLK